MSYSSFSTSVISVKSTRRKLDPRRALPVYRAGEINDADATPVGLDIATGVDKEEEREIHLQNYMQAYAGGTAGLVDIPVPDATQKIAQEQYECLYKATRALPSTLIRFSAPLEDLPAGSAYNLDEQDDAWLTAFREAPARKRVKRNHSSDHMPPLSDDVFELVMHVLEQVTAHHPQVPTFAQVLDLVGTEPTDDPQLLAWLPHVYPWWRERRELRNNLPIVPSVCVEEPNIRNESDPYVCFRRREVKQVRKTRRSDAQAYSHLKRIRIELDHARVLMGLVLDRELNVLDNVRVERDTFKARTALRNLKRQLNVFEESEMERYDFCFPVVPLVVQASSPRKLSASRPAQSPAPSAVPKFPSTRAGPKPYTYVQHVDQATRDLPSMSELHTRRVDAQLNEYLALDAGKLDVSLTPHAIFHPMPPVRVPGGPVVQSTLASCSVPPVAWRTYSANAPPPYLSPACAYHNQLSTTATFTAPASGMYNPGFNAGSPPTPPHSPSAPHVPGPWLNSVPLYVRRALLYPYAAAAGPSRPRPRTPGNHYFRHPSIQGNGNCHVDSPSLDPDVARQNDRSLPKPADTAACNENDESVPPPPSVTPRDAPVLSLGKTWSPGVTPEAVFASLFDPKSVVAAKLRSASCQLTSAKSLDNTDTKESRWAYRRRVGRNGRVLVDRRWIPASSSLCGSAQQMSLVSANGLVTNGPSRV